MAGNHNSGRKAGWKEKQDGEFLEILWNEGFSKKDLKDKLSQDQVPGKYVIAAKFYQGDKAVISEILRKVFPDKLDVSGNFIVPINVKRGQERK